MQDLLVFIPLTVLIVSALATKKMAESMIAATLVAMAMLHKGNFLSGTIDSFYATLSNDSFQFVVLILVTFGGVIQLLQKSGALTGFGNLLAQGVRRAVAEKGLLGAFTGGFTAAAGGICAAVFFGLIVSLLFKSKEKY